MRTMIIFVILLTIGAITALLIPTPTPATIPSPDVAVATFRYQFLDNASALKSSASFYCVSYQDIDVPSSVGDLIDPPKEVVAALSDVRPIVKAYSQCPFTVKELATARTIDGHPLIFTLRAMTCANASKCSVEGGYYEGNLSSSGDTYSLEKRDGKWIVVRHEMNWIS